MNATDSRLRHGNRRRQLLLLLGTVAIVYFLSPFVLCRAGRWLNVGERLSSPVDYAFVLGGEATTRPFLAAAIYRAGYARSVLLPEGLAPSEQDEFHLAEHQIQRAVLIHRGVPAEDIIQLPGVVDSTRDEAHVLATFLTTNPQSSVAVVTSDFHTRRTRLIFRRILPAHRNQIHFVACPTDGFGPDDWWHYRDGILWYVAEYAKLTREFLR
jgi:uncharacterized SAM-binding protein YcdF (DUF218 family)